MELAGLGEGPGEGDASHLTSVAFTKPVTFCDTSGHSCVLWCEHSISSHSPCSKSMGRESSHPY